jgi:diaminohydroxyphosphoribosylaminopyrimidine deaminase/5-amino-6-(5-phosphoribosylamino)uracil reductase
LDGFKGRQPLRVVLDSDLRSPPGAKMFAGAQGDTAAAAEVLIFTALGGVPVAAAASRDARREVLLAQGVQMEIVPAEGGYLDLVAVLHRLGELEVNEVLVEAGPTLAGQLLTTFLTDELLLYIAPKLIGPQGRPLLDLPELQSLQDALGFSLFDAQQFGDDLRLRWRPKVT